MKERTPSGCIASTLKLAFLAGVIIAIWMLWSCSVTKYGCPSEDQKVLNKAANRTFNK